MHETIIASALSVYLSVFIRQEFSAMKQNIYCLVTKGHHHIMLILACNWLHFVDKNFCYIIWKLVPRKLYFYREISILIMHID